MDAKAAEHVFERSGGRAKAVDADDHGERRHGHGHRVGVGPDGRGVEVVAGQLGVAGVVEVADARCSRSTIWTAIVVFWWASRYVTPVSGR